MIYIRKESIERMKYVRYLIFIITSSLIFNAGFNVLDLGINFYQCIKKRVKNNKKIVPTSENDSGDVIKVISIKG